jgi:hypothetical protein
VSAREIWKKHRAGIHRYRLVGKETGDELLRLQAVLYCWFPELHDSF